MNCARRSRNSTASATRWPTSASTLKKGLRSITTPSAPASARPPARKNMSCSNHLGLFPLTPQRSVLGRVGEQHLLREDQVRALVVGQLVVVAHRDRVERAGDLAVAAEDAAGHVDLVDRGVALAGGDLVLGRVLGRHHANAL